MIPISLFRQLYFHVLFGILLCACVVHLFPFFVLKLLPLGDDVAFICGHGPGSSIGHERTTNPFLTGEM